MAIYATDLPQPPDGKSIITVTQNKRNKIIFVCSCNEFKCGDISPSTETFIRNNLKQERFSFVRKEGETVILPINQKVVKLVRKEAPKISFDWTQNGFYINQSDHFDFNLNNLHIKRLTKADSGVYICMLNRIKKKIIVRVFTVAVISNKYDVITRETRRLILDCKAVLLGYVYSNLVLKLVLNDQVFLQYESGMVLATINVYDIQKLNKSHHGEWQCIVEQPDLEISWVTNYIKVNVLEPPNLLINLMEDEMTAPFFSWMKYQVNVGIALIFIILFAFGLFGAIIYVYKRFCTLPGLDDPSETDE